VTAPPARASRRPGDPVRATITVTGPSGRKGTFDLEDVVGTDGGEQPQVDVARFQLRLGCRRRDR